MANRIAFSPLALAWLDQVGLDAARVHEWLFRFIDDPDWNPGEVMPGFEPSVRRARIPGAGVEVTYCRYVGQSRIRILLIRDL